MTVDVHHTRTAPPDLTAPSPRAALPAPRRYVILHHELPAGCERATHWDLMCEADGVLKTWAITEPLELDVILVGDKLPDHRLAYLDYEGPVAGNRGCVRRWDRGECFPVLDISFRYVSMIQGGRFGTAWLHLERITDHRWLCRFTPAPSAAT